MTLQPFCSISMGGYSPSSDYGPAGSTKLFEYGYGDDYVWKYSEYEDCNEFGLDKDANDIPEIHNRYYLELHTDNAGELKGAWIAETDFEEDEEDEVKNIKIADASADLLSAVQNCFYRLFFDRFNRMLPSNKTQKTEYLQGMKNIITRKVSSGRDEYDFFILPGSAYSSAQAVSEDRSKYSDPNRIPLHLKFKKNGEQYNITGYYKGVKLPEIELLKYVESW